MQLSNFPASRFSADGKTLPSYLPFPDHGLPFLHASSPNSPSCGFILSFPLSLIYKILPYKLCNRPLEFTKNKNKKLKSWPHPNKKNKPKRLRTDTLLGCRYQKLKLIEVRHNVVHRAHVYTPRTCKKKSQNGCGNVKKCVQRDLSVQNNCRRTSFEIRAKQLIHTA